jgi:cobalt/nickel transport system ATP-binding protein
LIPLDPVSPFHLTVRDLSVTFRERTVLNSIQIEVTGGEVVALVGCNGSGKTTLLRALVGFQEHGGSVTATDGCKVDLGLVYQNPDLQLFNPTVRVEILYKLPSFENRLYRWLLTSLGLARYEGVSPLLLSEGEKKRLCLAMVLMHRPQHGMLLDEPTLGQDDRHRRMLGFMVRALARTGRLVMVATHDLAWALNYATRMIVLHGGHILAEGEPLALLSNQGLWKEAGLQVPRWIWEPIA